MPASSHGRHRTYPTHSRARFLAFPHRKQQPLRVSTTLTRGRCMPIIEAPVTLERPVIQQADPSPGPLHLEPFWLRHLKGPSGPHQLDPDGGPRRRTTRPPIGGFRRPSSRTARHHQRALAPPTPWRGLPRRPGPQSASLEVSWAWRPLHPPPVPPPIPAPACPLVHDGQCREFGGGTPRYYMYLP